MDEEEHEDPSSDNHEDVSAYRNPAEGGSTRTAYVRVCGNAAHYWPIETRRWRAHTLYYGLM